MTQSTPLFLKLGGSLITDKTNSHTARAQTIIRLATEIHDAMLQQPSLRVVIGHGAGSFGHMVAHKHRTNLGVKTSADWRGFAEVASSTARLNRLVFDALSEAGVPVINVQPSASAICHNGKLTSLAHHPIRAAVEHGLVPLVHGDVAFDTTRGGTIISTEAIFRYLASFLHPNTILLAGLEKGVLDSYPEGHLIHEITPANYNQIRAGLQQPYAPDVTGGMVNKVSEMLALSTAQRSLQIHVFSGTKPGAVANALLRQDKLGTLIHAPHLPHSTLTRNIDTAHSSSDLD